MQQYDYPVCYNFPVSHDIDNYALKVGVEYQLSVREEVKLSEV
jgi:muramoyltetrapeptide carboxypeptidase